jgi:hypothetical protein
MPAFKKMRAFVPGGAERMPFDQLVEPIAFLPGEPDHIFLDRNLFPGHGSPSSLLCDIDSEVPYHFR